MNQVKLIQSVSVGIAGLLLGPVAQAQSADAQTSEPSPPPKIQVAVPPPSAPVERTYKVHRDFYLGLQAGVGIFGADFDDNAPGETENISGSGFNLSLDALVGYAPTPGFAIGGALLNDFLLSTDFERGDQSLGDESARTSVFGAFVDGFPRIKGPWRLGGALGLAQLHGNNLAFDGDSLDEWGLGFGGWVGYTPWIGDHFSMGVTLRALAGFDLGGDTSANSRSLNLMWTGLYF